MVRARAGAYQIASDVLDVALWGVADAAPRLWFKQSGKTKGGGRLSRRYLAGLKLWSFGFGHVQAAATIARENNKKEGARPEVRVLETRSQTAALVSARLMYGLSGHGAVMRRRCGIRFFSLRPQ